MFSQVTKLHDGIYLVTTTNSHALAMLFWRVQETFDGEWAEQNKTIPRNFVEFMDWYAKRTKSGTYTYADDWEGYNIPRRYMEEVYTDLSAISDVNHYDRFMAALLAAIKADCGDGNFCVLGTIGKDFETLKHELAHAFFSLDGNYKVAQLENLRAITASVAEKLLANLKTIGYSGQVLPDEAQAYLSTGILPELRKDMGPRQLTLAARPFIEVFNKKLAALGLDRIFLNEKA